MCQTFHLCRFLQQNCERNGTHSCTGSWSVRNVDGVNVMSLEICRLLNGLVEVVTLWRNHLDNLDKFFFGQFSSEPRSLFERNRPLAVLLSHRMRGARSESPIGRS